MTYIASVESENMKSRITILSRTLKRLRMLNVPLHTLICGKSAEPRDQGPPPVEIVPDPGFDDAGAWDDSAVPVTVSGSQLTVLSGYSLNFGATPPLLAEIGATYDWELDVAQISPVGTYAVTFGGVVLWQSAKPPGVYSGTITATGTTALDFIFFVGMNQSAIFNSISIKKHQ